MEYDPKIREYHEGSMVAKSPLKAPPAPYATGDPTSFASVSAIERWPVILVRCRNRPQAVPAERGLRSVDERHRRCVALGHDRQRSGCRGRGQEDHRAARRAQVRAAARSSPDVRAYKPSHPFPPRNPFRLMRLADLSQTTVRPTSPATTPSSRPAATRPGTAPPGSSPSATSTGGCIPPSPAPRTGGPTTSSAAPRRPRSAPRAAPCSSWRPSTGSS